MSQDINFAVIITRIEKNYTKEEAKDVALLNRGKGYHTEVVTLDQLAQRRISDPNQQDLTLL